MIDYVELWPLWRMCICVHLIRITVIIVRPNSRGFHMEIRTRWDTKIMCFCMIIRGVFLSQITVNCFICHMDKNRSRDICTCVQILWKFDITMILSVTFYLWRQLYEQFLIWVCTGMRIKCKQNRLSEVLLIPVVTWNFKIGKLSNGINLLNNKTTKAVVCWFPTFCHQSTCNVTPQPGRLKWIMAYKGMFV